jgi:hypothetical protein
MLLNRAIYSIISLLPVLFLSSVPDCNTVTDQDFESIIFNENVAVSEIMAQDQSWELLMSRINHASTFTEEDEFIEQSKTVYFGESFFRYSDYGTPGEFTLTNITIVGPELYFKLKGRTIRIGDSIDTITSWPHTMVHESSKVHLHIIATDSTGKTISDNENNPIRSDYVFLTFIFDAENNRITQIDFTWRIV